MAEAPRTPTDRLATFLERASGFKRADQERIVDALLDRLEALDRAEGWRAAA